MRIRVPMHWRSCSEILAWLQAAALLVCLGLLSVGLTSEPLKTGCGLRSILQGFGIFYAAVEPALAVIWMMADKPIG